MKLSICKKQIIIDPTRIVLVTLTADTIITDYKNNPIEVDTMKKGLITLLGLSTLCASAMTFAAGHVDHGAYADLGAGYGKTNIDYMGAKNKGFAGTANLGYQFTPMLAVEAGVTGYQRKINDVRSYNTHLAAKGIVSLGDKVDVFGKLGAAYVHGVSAVTETDMHKVRPYVGAGVSYYLTDNLAATVQAEATTKYKKELPAMYAATAGLTYKFG